MTETPTTKLELLRSLDEMMGKLDDIVNEGNVDGVAVMLIRGSRASVMLHGIDPPEAASYFLQVGKGMADAVDAAAKPAEGEA